jgi:phosphoribosylamine--glycine ligase
MAPDASSPREAGLSGARLVTVPVPARILVVGGGGREHALAWKLSREPGVIEVVVAPGSAAIGMEPGVRTVGVDPLDPAAVAALAAAEAVDLVVVGPEAPLGAGLADALVAAGIPVFGPVRAAARLETSKAFCHEVAAAAGVRSARSRAFAAGGDDDAAAFIRELTLDGLGVVLKADGLAAGKGVVVTESEAQAIELLPSFLAGRPADGPALVVEERLSGHEASVIAVCDGTRAVALPAARDHKRLLDDDRGPNTGGMGAYSPLPDLDDDAVDDVLRTVHRPILAEMARRGTPFRGFLYAGLMLTADGPALLEINVRLGDPEAQAILPRLAGDLAPLLLAAATSGMPDGVPPRLPVHDDAAVAIVLAAHGYPDDPRRGDPIEGLESATGLGALVFHAGTRPRTHPDDGPSMDGGFETNGGRVLAVVGRAPDVASARAAAERAADAVTWGGLQRRHDIAAVLPVPVEVPA